MISLNSPGRKRLRSPLHAWSKPKTRYVADGFSRASERRPACLQSRELSRIDRERLLLNGFVQEVMKGWLISSSPDSRDGDSTPWYASFWEFCARYCSRRFGNEWCLSPEESFLLHAEKAVIPPVVIVQSPKGTNHDLSLLFGTSLYDLKQARMPPPAELTLRNGLRLFTPEAALIRVSESFITNNPIETRVVVAGLRDTTELLHLLLAGGHSVIAGRLAGTLRRTGRPDAAREIIATMKATGYDVREIDPFAGQQALGPAPASTAPIVGRMQAMWHSMREKVLEAFPPPPGLPITDRASAGGQLGSKKS